MSVPLTPWSVWAGVAAGGALGACARYGLSVALSGPGLRWPLATLVANLLGCFVAGFAAVAIARHGAPIGAPQLMLTVGFLGAFTTFSAFSVETLRLFEGGQITLAAWHVGTNVVGTLAAVALGAQLARAV